jgi:hypothetical protein
MRILALLLLATSLHAAEFSTERGWAVERSFFFDGPGGKYGFYDLPADGRKGSRGILFLADRGIELPFRVSRGLIAAGISSVLLIGGSIWYRRRYRVRHDNAA